MVWSLEEFVDIDLSSKSSFLARKQRKPHKTKGIEMPEEGICFPLNSEYDSAIFFIGGSQADQSAVAIGIS